MGFRGIVGMIYMAWSWLHSNVREKSKQECAWVLTSQATVRAWLDDIQDDTLAHPVQ